MSHFLDKLTFFTRKSTETFSDDYGISTEENRDWEEAYRGRWSHDKIIRSTHGVNCTGSCSWKIYVKGGLVTWETQQTDYRVSATLNCFVDWADTKTAQPCQTPKFSRDVREFLFQHTLSRRSH